MKFFEKTRGYFDHLKTLASAQDGLNISCVEFDNRQTQIGPRTFYYKDNFSANEIVSAALSTAGLHFMSMNNPFVEKEFNQSVELVRDPKKFFDNPGGMILGEEALQKTIVFDLRHSKEVIYDELYRFLQKQNAERLQTDIQSLFEELYMNAIIDAPRIANLGSAETQEREQVEIAIAIDDEQVALSITDNYGSLDVQKFLKRTQEVQTKGAGKAMNMGSGGAGIGCYIMFERSVQIFLGVIAGEKTVVSCVVPLGVSNKKKETMGKSLHIVCL